MGKPAVGVVCLETLIIVALMDSTLNCFSDKGRRLWKIETKGPITCLERIQLKNKNLDMVSIACGTTIFIYSTAGELLDQILFDEGVSTIYFGQYGRETNSMAVVTIGMSTLLDLNHRL
jgi:Bardet-Biedl syndrome 1 protein